MSNTPRLYAKAVTLAYERRVISEKLSVAIPDGSFTVIVGPNASGKSTLLRALARLLPPSSGQIVLDGKEIGKHAAKAVASRIRLLPQSSIAPEGISVFDLVSRGRYPHQSFQRQWSKADEAAVWQAMELTGIADLAARPVDELSGGQRQRVWIGMVLAQETPILLLDEPTTFLDIAHQIELLDLCQYLSRHCGRTLVAVLHDLNHACRYATHIIAMRDGTIVAEGEPATITSPLVEDVFGLSCMIIDDPISATPLIVPRSKPRG
ncbi:iron-dicitrate transporter ATP-binding subunit [Sinorhizobium sp. A49]|uniref:ABC transporter ATP-binding protein n=1 Tax=Sinorhizobium sp. A49 TaxID=1945861 RepID=UPI0009863957|nr:ABC transporter ATP-binding protein [Sinorhizobium sp. A49]OOG65699.1 iron-dicitrate transporter ATP-binding subunit [Sinorhizobium sp. A49]